MNASSSLSTNNTAKGKGMIDVNLLLAMGATLRDVAKGDFIFQEGTHCRFYHQLVSGSVRWVNTDDKGKEYIQAFIDTGESFGEFPLFDDGPYAASAIANEDSVIIRLKKETFLQLLKEDQSLHLRFDKKLVERLRFKFLLLRMLSNHTPEERVNNLLDFLKGNQKHICPNCHQIKLTRQQIADLCGLRVETVIRVVRRMHDEGRLLVENRKIYYS
jgi:CRP-like cAMP-binding protein